MSQIIPLSHFPVMYRKISQYMKLFIKIVMTCIEKDNQRVLYSLVISSNLEDSSTIFKEQQSALKIQSNYISTLKFWGKLSWQLWILTSVCRNLLVFPLYDVLFEIFMIVSPSPQNVLKWQKHSFQLFHVIKPVIQKSVQMPLIRK